MAVTLQTPAHPDVVADLDGLRHVGLLRLRSLSLPALSTIACLVAGDEHDEEHSGDGFSPRDSSEVVPLIELTLRQAVERLGGGEDGDAAAHLLGLSPGTRGRSSAERRELAAAAMDRSADTFRKRYEKDVLATVADQLLMLCAEQRLRLTRTRLERRQPAESRLAVQWVERFEAYNRIWTPAWALGADLTAYRLTLLEADSPYDRAPGTEGPDDPGYTQEEQAEGYARFALFRYAAFAWEVRQFMVRHGGLWLLSSSETETAVSDAVYRITWHVTPFNERDQSWLRSTVGESRGQELDHFLRILSSTGIGQRTHGEWQEWVATCQCTWDLNLAKDTAQGHFPTSKTHEGVSAGCQVHQVVEACGVYCDLIDAEWVKIADWYHLGSGPRRGVSSGELYGEWRALGRLS